jgi:hypothetical protein
MVGTLVGDARLLALDAFLDSLSNATKNAQQASDLSMSEALRQLVEKCHPTILARCDVILEVTSKLDLEQKEMVHTFRISAQAKK